MSDDLAAPAHLLQPALHDLVSLVAAPALSLSDRDGQIRSGGVSGWYVDDVRLLERCELTVEDGVLELVRSAQRGSATADYSYVVRTDQGTQPDPTLTVDRRRSLSAEAMVEELTFASTASQPVHIGLTLQVGSDLASMASVRDGRTPSSVPPVEGPAGLAWPASAPGCTITCQPGPTRTQAEDGRLSWDVVVDPGGQWSCRIVCSAPAAAERVFGPGRRLPWSVPGVSAADPRLSALVEQSCGDLEGLLMTDLVDPRGDQFLAAGSPWYLTLFGRDSLWAARLMLPLGTDLALSTLRVLARRQGRKEDPASEEQPGKILHEVRLDTLEVASMQLPPVYYGTVDATALFVITLAEARQWGAPPNDVRELLPAARAALGWLLEQSQQTGWLEYVDASGHGLANQGWKDSVDAVRHRDGSLAEPPIALCEVQAYAYQAAVLGSELLSAFGEPPVAGLDAWAARLRERFRASFWAAEDGGRYPVIALDGSGARAESVTSNMGQLLGTGLLDHDEAAQVADRICGPDLDSGFGLRTLSTLSPAFAGLSYHCGSVWPHDTAIVVRGLAAEGFSTEAATLTAGMVRAAEAFDYRLPELYGGDAASDVPAPSAYPAACHPQAWSSAAPLACLVAATGLRVDVPARTLTHPARVSTTLGPYELTGLKVAGAMTSVQVDGDGMVSVETRADVAVVTVAEAP